MRQNKVRFATLTLAFSLTPGAHADWSDFFNTAINQVSQQGGTKAAESALSNSEVVSGLKEALANGVKTAINQLGHSGGFLNDKAVRIAVPDSLKTAANAARMMGQGQYVDELELTMNKAAEKAVPQAADVLSDAIRQMSISDAMAILNGPDDAATQYFRKTSEASLTQRLKPIVSQATDQAGVTASYKKLTSQAMPLLGTVMDTSNLDIDQYVTKKTLNGLFKYIADYEKSIRANPAARTTELLKKVFGN